MAERSGTLDRFVFDTSADDATWDDARQRWMVTTSGGTYAARTLISGAGGLSEPKLPEIEGIETFQGEVFHSARWNHDVDLTGKRVAVIGTGASAIQIVPAIQEKVGHLDVYQRTAPYVMPRNDRPYTGIEKAALQADPRRAVALPDRDLLGPRGLRAGLHAAAQARLAGQAAGAEEHRSAASTTPSCARRSPRPSRSAASGS